MVGMTRFELAASSSRTKRATGLRYIPNRFALQKYTFFSYDVQIVFQIFLFCSKGEEAQMFEEDLQSDENQDDAANDPRRFLVFRAEHVADFHAQDGKQEGGDTY